MTKHPSAPAFLRSVLAAVMLATFIGTGVSSAFADSYDVVEPADGIEVVPETELGPVGAEPVPVGTKVVHDFDVVVANMFDSADQIPSGPAPMTVTQSTIDQLLSDAAQWWSDHTGLDFDFSQNTHYKAINSTCDTWQGDSMAVYGQPDDYSSYTHSTRDMMVLNINHACSDYAGMDYAGLAWTTSPTGDVFTGGVFEIVIQPDNLEDSWDDTVRATAHEFGHTVGLMHANVLDCSQVVTQGDDHIGVSWDGSYLADGVDGCVRTEYADVTSIMGSSTEISGLNSLEEWYLGVARDDVTIIDSPVHDTITVSRHDLTDTDSPQGIVVSYDTGNVLGAFGVEYLAADETNGTIPGVYITVGRGEYELATDILLPVGNRTHQTSIFDQPLMPGRTFVSADGRVSIRTVDMNETTAHIEINVGKNLGVAGTVNIRRDGDSLQAVVASTQATNVTYQWFSNGTQIPGEVNATYTPVLPDPNAVYRVEATMTGDGRGPTTRYSRGIIVNDHRASIDGDTATFTFVDENGQPHDCAGATIGLTIRTSSDALVANTTMELSGTARPGVCQGTIDFPLSGTFHITAASAEASYDYYVGFTNEWLEPYWQPQTFSWTKTVDEATAVLYVGTSGDYVPGYLEVGTGAPPLPVLVSVTNDDGSPAVDVPVSITIPDGMILTPTSPLFTDEDGLAYAELQWNPDVEPPIEWSAAPTYVTATVDGFSQVTSSPTNIYLAPPAVPLIAWLDKATAVADGTDFVTLYVRVWDESGKLIENQPDSIQADFVNTPMDISWLGAFSEPVWDSENKWYTITITPQTTGDGHIEVWTSANQYLRVQLYSAVSFTPGPAVSFAGAPSVGIASQNGICDSDATVVTVEIWPLTALFEYGFLDEPGIIVSVPDGSPLTIVGNSVVTQTDDLGHYYVEVTSSVPGSFDMNVTSMDGSITTPITLLFGNGPIDLDASSFTVTDGLRTPDGTDAHTVTANLVSQCHVPMVLDLEDWNWNTETLDLEVHNSEGSDSSDATASEFVPDPDHLGVYTAEVTSTKQGTYDADVIFHHWDEEAVETTMTVATLPVAFGDQTQPPSSSPSPSPSTSSSTSPSPFNPSTSPASNPSTSPAPNSSTSPTPNPSPSGSQPVAPPASSGTISVQTGGSVAHHTTWWFLPLIALGCGCLAVWRYRHSA